MAEFAGKDQIGEVLENQRKESRGHSREIVSWASCWICQLFNLLPEFEVWRKTRLWLPEEFA